MIKRWIIFITLISLFCLNIHFSTSWEVWGQELPSGNEIQIFWYSRISDKDFRIPQDLEIVEIDEFSVWFRFTNRSQSSINFSVQVWDFSLAEKTQIDPETNESFRSIVRIYDKLVVEKSFLTLAGENVGDTRFGVEEINAKVLPEFKSTNQTQLVQVVVEGIVIEFHHLTNPAEIEVIKTRSAWNIELIMFLISSICIIMFFVLLAVGIHYRAGYSPSPPAWYFYPFVLMGAFFIMVMFVLLQGLPIEVFIRNVSVMPPYYISITFGVWLTFYLIHKFKSHLEPYLIFGIRTVNNKLRISPHVLKVYRRKNKQEAVVEEEDWSEFVRRLFVGGIKLPDPIVNPIITILSDNVDDFPQIRAVSSVFKKVSKFSAHFPKHAKYTVSFFILTILMIFLPLMLNMASPVSSGFTLILFGASIFALVIDSITITPPILEISPLQHKSEVEMLVTARAVQSAIETMKEMAKQWAEDRAQASQDSVAFLTEALTMFNKAYTGKIDLDEKSDLETKDIEDLKELSKVLKWEQVKELFKKLEIESVKKKKDMATLPIPTE